MPTKSDFLLDPTVVFLNHGSFGACPRPVFEAYQQFQRRLELQPVLFFRELNDLDRAARQALGAYLNTDADNLVFVPNVTHGVNIITHSLALSPDDEILTTDHEYGACDTAWEYACVKTTGAIYRHQHIALPARSEEEIMAQFWQGVTERTKVIYLSHITSPTALRMPVEAICARARELGILTVIDGAHAPGQLALDLQAIGADFYTGNCHKWMLSPKGAGFLYTRPEMQKLVEPLVVGWGYHQHNTAPQPGSTRYLDYLNWTGTRDSSASLAVPAAIEFMQSHDWPQVRKRCHALLANTIERICAMVGLEPAYPLDSNLYSQMGIAPVPAATDLTVLKTRLYDEFRIEIPMIDWQGYKGVRISVQVYTTQADLDALVEALRVLLPQVAVAAG